MSNTAKFEIPGVGDDGLSYVYNETGDTWELVALATVAALSAHTGDPSGAHAASAISFSAGGSISATDVQTAIAEVATDYIAADAAHVAAGDPHTQYHNDTRGDARYWQLTTDLATQVELDAHINDTTAAHAASAIGFTAGGSIAATDVQAAIAEVATDYIAADAAHVAAGDPHTQYHNNARGDARYWPLSTDLATQVELDAHTTDTTGVHGITDTALILNRVTSNALTGDRIEIGNGTKAWQIWADASNPRITSKDGTALKFDSDITGAAATFTGLTIGADSIAELIRDTIGSALVAGTDISISVNDGADTITINAVGVPNIAYGTTAPGSPATGDFWLDTN